MKKLISTLILLLSFAISAFASLSATATITWTQVGSTYNYDVKLVNTGTTTVGTFWFSWTPIGSFMPISPTTTSAPTGWVPMIQGGGLYDGYSVEYTANTPLAAGATLDGFKFTSTITPAQLEAQSSSHPGYANLESFVYIGAAFGDDGYDLTVTVPPAATLSSLALNISSIVGGNAVPGTATISAAAGTSGFPVTLSSDNANATVPSSITVAYTHSNAPLSVTTKGVDAAVTAHITGLGGGVSKAATLIINPAALASITPTASVVGGNSVTAVVALNGKTGATAKSVTLSSNSASAVIPASVSIASQASQASVVATTKGVNASTSVILTAALGGVTKTGTVTLLPAVLKSAVVASSLVGGQALTGTLTLTGKSGDTPGTVTVTTTAAGAATIPVPTVPAQSVSTTFKVTSSPVVTDTSVSLSVTYGGVKSTFAVLVKAPVIASFTLASPTAIGGGPVAVGTVHLTGAAPAPGITVNLSNTPFASAVPTTVKVPTGGVAANFAITTPSVTTDTTDTVTAKLGTATFTATYTVRPWLSTFTPTNPSMGSNASATLLLKLNAVAPPGGLSIPVTYSNGSVTGAAKLIFNNGSNAALLSVHTGTIVAAGSTTVSAVYKGVTLSVVVSLHP
jgi:hypothetical protein